MPFNLEAQKRGGRTRAAQTAQTERNAKMVEMADEGYTFSQIGQAFGLTKPRAWQIVTRERKKRRAA